MQIDLDQHAVEYVYAKASLFALKYFCHKTPIIRFLNIASFKSLRALLVLFKPFVSSFSVPLNMAFGSSLLHLLLFTVFGFVLGNKHQTDGKISLCPYVESCIKKASKKADITIDISQCCPLCYCDRMCVDFSDCCPDVNVSSLPATNMAPADCLTSVYRTEYSYENASFLESRKYFQKRNCSEPFMSNNSITDRYEVEEKCEGNVSFENFDDIVMVSNMHHHEEVFFNKYCARCNGVSEIVR